MSLKIALTGGAASGKSTILGFAAAMGVETAGADEEAARLRGTPEVQAELALLTGMEAPLDTALLREALMKDPELRRKVNSLFHQRVLTSLLAGPAVLVEIPLLVETASWRFFDQVWAASCPLGVRLERLKTRLGSREAAERLAGLQASESAREAVSDHIIRTNQPLTAVKTLTEGLVRRYGLAIPPSGEDIIRVV